jgi:hypothetical protein
LTFEPLTLAPFSGEFSSICIFFVTFEPFTLVYIYIYIFDLI